MEQESPLSSITFDDKTKSAIEWINISKQDPKHPFAKTMVIRQTPQGKFQELSSVWDIADDDMADIKKGNAIHTSYLLMKKIGGIYTPVGAFIVGTRDKDCLEILHFGHMRSYMRDQK